MGLVEKRDPSREPLRQLVLAGNMLAAQLTIVAEELDASGQPDPDCIERKLVALWEQMLAAFIADLHIGPPPARPGYYPFPELDNKTGVVHMKWPEYKT